VVVTKGASVLGRFGGFEELQIQDDLVGANGMGKTKLRFGVRRCTALRTGVKIPTELIEKLIVPLESFCIETRLALQRLLGIRIKTWQSLLKVESVFKLAR
jgi:hypothetical protein